VRMYVLDESPSDPPSLRCQEKNEAHISRLYENRSS